MKAMVLIFEAIVNSCQARSILQNTACGTVYGPNISIYRIEMSETRLHNEIDKR